MWNANVRFSSGMILITEAWSYQGPATGGWSCSAYVGSLGTSPGPRFGVGGGIAPPLDAGRWGFVNSELPFIRHREPGDPGHGTQPIGRVTIGYADGHVSLKTNSDLASASTGLSTLDSMWSLEDPIMDH
jgi:prepilin-type processing-associated H-X9-DG protein